MTSPALQQLRETGAIRQAPVARPKTSPGYEKAGDELGLRVDLTNVPTRQAPVDVARRGARLHDGAIPPSVVRTVSSPGRPLESVVRPEMERRFGVDFSDVR